MNDSFEPGCYGAVADGCTKDTAAVQAAIDAAAAQGGTVRLEGGIFVCGTLYLKSNVALEITNSATLLASPDIADYGTDTHHNRYRNEPELDRCFLFAQDRGQHSGNRHGKPTHSALYLAHLQRFGCADGVGSCADSDSFGNRVGDMKNSTDGLGQ